MLVGPARFPTKREMIEDLGFDPTVADGLSFLKWHYARELGYMNAKGGVMLN